MFSKYRSVVEARKQLVSDVESAFLPAEASVINAATQVSACLTTMMERHAAANLKPLTGATVIDTLGEAAAMAVALRAKMMTAHSELAAAAMEVGFLEYVVPTCAPNEASLEEQTTAALSVRLPEAAA